MHFILLLLVLRHPSGLFSFMIPINTLYAFLISSLHVKCFYLIIFDLAVQIKLFSVSSLFQPPVFLPYRSKFYPHLHLLENSVLLYFFFNRFFTFIKRGKLLYLRILTLTVLDSRRKGKRFCIRYVKASLNKAASA